MSWSKRWLIRMYFGDTDYKKWHLVHFGRCQPRTLTLHINTRLDVQQNVIDVVPVHAAGPRFVLYLPTLQLIQDPLV
jgi:hypothetical protein